MRCCAWQVEVIDSVQDYRAMLQEVFDFGLLKKFVSRSDFTLVFDALWAVTGAYAGPLLVDDLGADASSIKCVPESVYSGGACAHCDTVRHAWSIICI